MQVGWLARLGRQQERTVDVSARRKETIDDILQERISGRKVGRAEDIPKAFLAGWQALDSKIRLPSSASVGPRPALAFYHAQVRIYESRMGLTVGRSEKANAPYPDIATGRDAPEKSRSMKRVVSCTETFSLPLPRGGQVLREALRCLVGLRVDVSTH